MDPERLRPILRLLLAPGMHSAALARLLAAFGDDPGRALAASRREVEAVPGIGPALAAALAGAPGSREDADREVSRALDLGAALVGPGDPGYPHPLLRTYDPPPVLYSRGTWLHGDCLAVSVVGSRRATPYGAVQAARFGRGLAEAGMTVVSGLARGVDTAAHRGALQAPGGRTVAVLGSGFARPYPSENVPLLAEIAERGAVLSEFPLDAAPLPHHFPLRNRVLAALGLGTLVVEASERSGSLITAVLAAEAGKTVMGVPGRVDSPNSRGVHRLLREGAHLVESVEQVFEALEIPPPEADPPASPEGEFPADAPAGRLLAALRGRDGLDAEELGRATGLEPREVRAALADLEVAGAIRPFPGGRWART